MIKEYLSAGEIAGIEEEKALSQPQEDLEPISDNEEDDILSNSQPAAPSKCALRKRRRSISPEPRDEIDRQLDDDDVDHPLPNIVIYCMKRVVCRQVQEGFGSSQRCQLALKLIDTSSY